MPIPTLSQVWFWAFTVICAGAGAFIGAYLKEKAKNFATREDFEGLKKQTQELTNATKEIEAKIEDQVWNRQRQWEMKRDALVKGIQALERADEALMNLGTASSPEGRELMAGEAEWQVLKAERAAACNEAINGFDHERILIDLVCGTQCREIFRGASKAIRAGVTDLLRGKANSYGEVTPEVHRYLVTAYRVAREEVGVDGEPITPQSSEASAASTPVTQATESGRPKNR